MSPSNDRTKVVVRNLPPTLAADAFQSAINKHAEGSYDWLAYYQGKVSLKRTVFSRAFLNFNTPEAVYDFKAKFDGHVFVSTRGTQYRCTVEYAPFQKVPTVNTKKLAMEGTIQKDADYQAFVKALEEGPRAVPTAQAQLEAQEASRASEEPALVVTALMAFLQKKYENVPFPSRRGSKSSRPRREMLPNVSEEKSSKGKPAKATKTKAAVATDAATAAAAAAGAVEKALKGTKHQSTSSKGKEPQSRSSKERQTEAVDADQASMASKSKRQPSKQSRASSKDAGTSAAATNDKLSKRPASSSATGTTSAAPSATGDGRASREAAAAALAAASAANAAAAAARKSRVKAGHEVYTPGAGAARARLLAAALPKPAAEGRGSADAVHAGRPATTAAPGKGKGDRGPAREQGSRDNKSSSGSRAKATAAEGAAAGTAAGASGDASAAVGSAGCKASPEGKRGSAAGDTVGSNSRPRAGGSHKSASDRRGSAHGDSSKQQQQQWVIKPGGAG